MDVSVWYLYRIILKVTELSLMRIFLDLTYCVVSNEDISGSYCAVSNKFISGYYCVASIEDISGISNVVPGPTCPWCRQAGLPPCCRSQTSANRAKLTDECV